MPKLSSCTDSKGTALITPEHVQNSILSIWAIGFRGKKFHPALKEAMGDTYPEPPPSMETVYRIVKSPANKATLDSLLLDEFDQIQAHQLAHPYQRIAELQKEYEGTFKKEKTGDLTAKQAADLRIRLMKAIQDEMYKCRPDSASGDQGKHAKSKDAANASAKAETDPGIEEGQVIHIEQGISGRKTG